MLNLAFANRLRSGLLGSALALLVASPAPATAAPKNSNEPPNFSLAMEVRGSHGYSVGIGADDHRTVSITAFKEKGDTYTTYSVPGRASSEGIEANFGKFGRISLDFTPSGKPPIHRGRRGCHTIRGHFDGVIRFRGELGYTQVTAKHARGTLNPDGRGACDSRANTRPGRFDLLANPADLDLGLTVLAAVAHTGGRRVSFVDSEINEIAADGKLIPSLTISGASSQERRGRIAISRQAILFLERTVTAPSPPGQLPATATVVAPKPFRGSASYLAAPGAEPTWTGDLSVTLLGAGLVPLTGPDFDALLCTGALNKANEACLGEVEDLVRTPGTGTASLTSFGTQAPAAASRFIK